MEKLFLVDISEMKRFIAAKMVLNDMFASKKEDSETMSEFADRILSDSRTKKCIVTFEFDCGMSQTLPITMDNLKSIKEIIVTKKFSVKPGHSVNVTRITMCPFESNTMSWDKQWNLPSP